MNICMKCKAAAHNKSAKYCYLCGAALVDDTRDKVCTQCGHKLGEYDIYCPECGTKRGGAYHARNQLSNN